MEREPFDALAYWEDRHVRLAGDHRNVGDMGLDSAQNLDLITAKAVIVAHHLGSIGINPGARLLDAGCGAGVLTRMMAHAGFNMVGIDGSAKAIAEADELGHAAYEVAPLYAFHDEKPFDAVLCLDVMFHVTDDDLWRQSVAALLKATSQGGALIIIEHFPGTQSKGAHCRWRDEPDYSKVLDGLGGQIVKRHDFKYPHRPETKTLLDIRHTGGAG